MKNLILAFCLLVSLSAFAQMRIQSGKFAALTTAAPSGGGGCTTTNIYMYSIAADHTQSSPGWFGSSFTTTNAFTVCGAMIQIYKSGNPVSTFTCSIYTDNSGQPGTIIGTPSGSVTSSTLGTTTSWVTMPDGISASLSSSTKYWFVLKYSGADSGGDVAITQSFTVGGSDIKKSSNDGSTWGVWNPGDSLKIVLKQ